MNKEMPNYYIAPNTPEKGEHILILLANQFNEVEFFYPYYRLIEAGYQVSVAGLEKGDCIGKYNIPFPINLCVDEIPESEWENFDMLYIPGGKAPENLRKNAQVLKLTKYFAQHKKPIVSICHGPLVLADADVIKGKKVACWPEIKDTVTNAGAIYTDAALVEDDGLITSRWPGDLPGFTHRMIERLH